MLLDLSEAALINYKRDRIPKVDELHKIAAHFGVSMDWLYTGQGVSPASSSSSAWQARAEAAESKLEALKAAMTVWLKKL